MAFWVRDTESVAEFRYFWEDKPMTLWRGLFVGKQRAVYRQLQHAQYSGQTKTHHLILFYAEYLWSLNLNLAGWIAGLKENFLPTVFWFSVSAVVGSISIPRIFQLEYPFPNFSDLVTFSNLMFACRRSGFTKPGFSILRVFSQNMKWNMVFPFSSLSTWGPHGVASCKLGDSVRKAWSTWHSQSLPRTSKNRSILSFWTWHITVQHSFRHSSRHSPRHELIEDASLKWTFRTISNYVRTMLLATFSFSKGGVVWVRNSPALQDGPQRSGKANEKLHAIKKNLVCSVPGQGLSPRHLRSHDGICWTNENWWSWMWKSPDWRPGLARLTDCWGHCSLLILSVSFRCMGPWFPNQKWERSTEFP